MQRSEVNLWLPASTCQTKLRKWFVPHPLILPKQLPRVLLREYNAV